MENGERHDFGGERPNFAWPAEEMPRAEIGGMNPNTVREIAEMAKREGVGAPVELRPEQSVPEVSAEPVVPTIDFSFDDVKQEKISKKTLAAVDRAVEEAGEDMAALNDRISDMGWDFVNVYDDKKEAWKRVRAA